MTLIPWRDEFALGIPPVDHEHHELIDLINALHERMLADPAHADAGEFLGEIYARIAAHFALEERIMRESRYDEYEDHKADHERLLDDIRDIMDDYEDRNQFDGNQLSARLERWFAIHFKTKDARLHHRIGG